MHILPASLLLFALAASATVQAGETRSAGRHEHGLGTLELAIDGNDMFIDLDGPAGNFTGFEHRPSTPRQSAALTAALDTLRAGDDLFRTPLAAACRMISAAVSPPANDDSGHADIEASWEFRCDNPAALLWVDTQLFAAFRNTKKLATRIVAPAGQMTVELNGDTTRIDFPRLAPSR